MQKQSYDPNLNDHFENSNSRRRCIGAASGAGDIKFMNLPTSKTYFFPHSDVQKQLFGIPGEPLAETLPPARRSFSGLQVEALTGGAGWDS